MNDFPDWLSPILVKELRQGLRSRSFGVLFILMQVVMIGAIMVSMNADGHQAGTVIFWILVGGGLLFFIPLQGVQAVASEIKGQSLELLTLTQLSAFRIVLGKWIAVVIQSLLLFCSILPYLVIRYFIGGMELLDDITTAAILLGSSVVVCAAAVGMSALFRRPSGIVLFVVGGIFFPQFARVGSGLLPQHLERVLEHWLALWLLAPWIILLFLEISTAKISPPGEGRTAFARLYALGLVLTCCGLGIAFDALKSFGVLALLLSLPTILVSITAASPTLPSLYRAPQALRFPKRPFLATVMQWLSAPDWVAGSIFSLLLIGIALLMVEPSVPKEVLPLLLTGVATLFLPLVVLKCFKSVKNKILPFYFGAQVVLFVFSSITLMNPTGISYTIGLLFPSNIFWASLRRDPVIDTTSFGVTGLALIVSLVVFAVTLFFARRERPARVALQREAAMLPSR